jgi:hypothetical protein
MCSVRRNDAFARAVDTIVAELALRGFTWRATFPTKESLDLYGDECGSLAPAWISE